MLQAHLGLHFHCTRTEGVSNEEVLVLLHFPPEAQAVHVHLTLHLAQVLQEVTPCLPVLCVQTAQHWLISCLAAVSHGGSEVDRCS